MPILPSGVNRLDVNNPADVQRMIDTGLAWRSGPKTLQVIIDHIQEGAVTRAPDKEPPEVRAFLDKIAPVPQDPAVPQDVEQPQDAEQETLS